MWWTYLILRGSIGSIPTVHQSRYGAGCQIQLWENLLTQWYKIWHTVSCLFCVSLQLSLAKTLTSSHYAHSKICLFFSEVFCWYKEVSSSCVCVLYLQKLYYDVFYLWFSLSYFLSLLAGHKDSSMGACFSVTAGWQKCWRWSWGQS